MLKKKLGAECIEERIINCHISWFYKVPSTLIIPEGCRGIRFGVFESCRKLEKVEIPESCEKIGDYAFEGCISLKRVIIPERVKERVKEYEKCIFFGCKDAEITVRDVKEEIRN